VAPVAPVAPVGPVGPDAVPVFHVIRCSLFAHGLGAFPSFQETVGVVLMILTVPRCFLSLPSMRTQAVTDVTVIASGPAASAAAATPVSVAAVATAVNAKRRTLNGRIAHLSLI
jgi:hypothetical protein